MIKDTGDLPGQQLIRYYKTTSPEHFFSSSLSSAGTKIFPAGTIVVVRCTAALAGMLDCLSTNGRLNGIGYHLGHENCPAYLLSAPNYWTWTLGNWVELSPLELLALQAT